MGKPKPKPKVKESTKYSNLVSSDSFPEEVEEDVEEWREHWKQMPEFSNEDNGAFKSLLMNFENEDDYKDFLKLINQKKLTLKTKSTWHPQKPKSNNYLYRWIEVDK
jgi:hypothetical protein